MERHKPDIDRIIQMRADRLGISTDEVRASFEGKMPKFLEHDSRPAEEIMEVLIRQSNADCRIDYDSAGELDDISIKNVSHFRMERMDDGCFWIRLYRDGKEDVIFWLKSEKPISGTHEFDERQETV